MEIGHTANLGEAVKGTIQQWSQKLKEAVAHCALDLEEANTTRRSLRGEPKFLEQWKELGQDLLHYLHAETDKGGSGGSIATQLSNIANIDLTQFPLVRLPQEARALQSILCGHP